MELETTPIKKNDLKKDTEKQMEEEKLDEKAIKEIEEVKKRLEEFKSKILKKFKFISAIGIIPSQANYIIEDAEELKFDKDEKRIHVIILIPDEKDTEYEKIKAEAIELTKDIKPKIWIHLKIMKELWDIALNSRFDYMEAIGMSFALHDTGILGALRVSSIHKNLVLKRFDKYVTSYVIGGSLVRGQATESSDIDVFVVIDDTDVKKMSRYELKEKLRAIIYQQVSEAGALAGVQNKLSPQVYILTEFWESIKDAAPVMFTFVRDGIPLYDRGAFLPWKMLLKMGKIKPSPEAIDMYVKIGDRVKNSVENKVTEIFMNDVYWGVITPSQAAFMLYGMGPPSPKEVQQGIFRKIFVEKEKLVEKKYANILEEIVSLYKQLEHNPKLMVTGKQLEDMTNKAVEFNKRLKKLIEQIEKRYNEDLINKVYNEVFDLLKRIVKKNSEEEILKAYEEELVYKGHVPEKSLKTIKEIFKAKRDIKKAEMTKHDVDIVRKNAVEVINMLIEYAQRKDFIALEKGKARIRYKVEGKEKEAVVFFLDNSIYLITEGDIQRISNGEIKKCKKEEFEEAIKVAKDTKLSAENFGTLKKLFKEFEFIF